MSLDPKYPHYFTDDSTRVKAVLIVKKKIFDDLKQALQSLPVKLPESEVIELARAAWKEAVIEEVHSG